MVKAMGKDDESELDELQQSYHKLAADLERAALTELWASAEADLEQQVIDVYSEYAASTNYQPLLASSPLGRLMGQLPVEGDRPVGGSDRYSTRFGNVSRNGWMLSFESISFVNAAEGAPALVKWLCAKGCIDIKYQFFSGFDLEEVE
jgi:hypothetical protein